MWLLRGRFMRPKVPSLSGFFYVEPFCRSTSSFRPLQRVCLISLSWLIYETLGIFLYMLIDHPTYVNWIVLYIYITDYNLWTISGPITRSLHRKFWPYLKIWSLLPRVLKGWSFTPIGLVTSPFSKKRLNWWKIFFRTLCQRWIS